VSLRISVARNGYSNRRAARSCFRRWVEETQVAVLTRRADLLNGIESRNGGKSGLQPCSPIFSRIGGRYLDHFKTDPWSSPVTTALRAASQRMMVRACELLGLIKYHTFGCGHPHIFTDAPYEEYERQFLPPKLLNAPPSSSLSCFPGRQHWIAALRSGQCGRNSAQKAFGAAQMSNFGDWRSLLAAYASVTPDDLRQALEQWTKKYS